MIFSSIISLYFVLYIYHSSIHTQPKNHHKHNEHPCYLLYQAFVEGTGGEASFAPQVEREATKQMPRRTGQQGDGEGSTISKNAKYASRKCKDSSLTNPSTFVKGCEHVPRKGPSTFENMPSCTVEDALLGARKAFSPTYFVTY